MKKRVLYFFTVLLIATFPCANFYYKVFRGLSVSFVHHFERSAPFAFHVPSLFQKYIHFYLTDFWILGLMIGALLLKEVKLKEFFFNRHSRFLTLYLGIALISVVISLFSSYYFLYTTLLNLTIAFIGFHVVYLLLRKKQQLIPTILWAFVGVAAVECFIGIGQFIFQHDLGLAFLSEPKLQPGTGFIAVIPISEMTRNLFSHFPWFDPSQSTLLRAYGTFDHPNTFAGYLVIALFSTYYLFIKSQRKLLTSALIFLFVLTMFLTFSRASCYVWVMGTALFLGVGIFKKGIFDEQQRKRLLILSSVIGGVFVVTIALLFNQLVVRGGFVNFNGVTAYSNNERLLFIKLGIALFLHYPLLGVGYNAFALYPYGMVNSELAGENMRGSLTHNIYLQIACETGLIGLITIGFFIGSLILPVFKLKLNALTFSLLMIIGSLLMLGMLDHYLWSYTSGRLMFFLFCSLFAASISNQKFRQKQQRSDQKSL